MPDVVETRSTRISPKFVIPGAGDSSSPASVSDAYREMSLDWELTSDLLGGTPTMRAAGRTWLPQEEAETDVSYTSRLERSFLMEAFSDTLANISAKPFAKPIIVETGDAELPEFLNPLISGNNVDKAGRSLTEFASLVFHGGLQHGMSGILVDFPENVAGSSIQARRDRDIRPSFTFYSAPQILGFTGEMTTSGSKRLTQVRLLEATEEPSGEFGQVTVMRIRVVTAPVGGESGWWELYRFNDEQKTWDVEVERTNHAFPGVYFSVFYTQREGFMRAKSPLMPLAWSNLDHWQSSSDQRNILKFARFPQLFFKGMTRQEWIEGGGRVGPGQAHFAKDPKAEISFIEHTGAAIEAGERALDRTERHMEQLGQQPFVERTATSTATGKVIDETRESMDLKQWIRNLESTLLQSFLHAAAWESFELPDGFSVDVWDDFAAATIGRGDMDHIEKMRDNRDISQETIIAEAKRRGMLHPRVDAEEERERILEEDLDPPPPLPGRDQPKGSVAGS